MDFAGLFKLVIFGFVGLGVICLWLALWLPKDVPAKVLLVLLVVGLFVGLPYGYFSKDWASIEEKRVATDAACLRSKITTGKMSPVQGFYTGHDALVLVQGTDGNEALNLDPNLQDIIRYMLDRRMTFLEMAMPSKGRLGDELRKINVQASDSPYLRLSVASAGAAECAPSAIWALDYPARKLPELRKRGLFADHCIAVEGVKAPLSRYRITSKLTPFTPSQNTKNGPTGYALEVQDWQTSEVTATLSLILSGGNSGSRQIQCGQGAKARQFQEIVPILPDPRLVHLNVLTNDESAIFSTVTDATSADLTAIGKIPGLDKVYSADNISDDGMIWFERHYTATGTGDGKHEAFFLTLVVDGELRRIVVNINDNSIGLITGLQVTKEHIRFVTKVKFDGPPWLLEYSRRGEPKRALSLTPYQVQLLK